MKEFVDQAREDSEPDGRILAVSPQPHVELGQAALNSFFLGNDIESRRRC